MKIRVAVELPGGVKKSASLKNPPRPRDCVLRVLKDLFGPGLLSDADGDLVMDDLQAGDYVYVVTDETLVPAVNWLEVLQLSSRQKEFLDGYLGNKYGLQQMDTSVAKIPKYMKLPSMLLFDLGRRRFTHAQGVKKEILDGKASGQQVVLVAGTPGCGKTRSLFDMFSEEDGFYFVMSTALNGGSEDMSLMVSRLEMKMLLNDKTGGNEGVFALLLLACRTVIYQYCKARGADSRQWLLLQAACRGMLGNYDVFTDFLGGALHALPEDRPGILSQEAAIRAVIISLCRSMPIPTVAIDEGQLALKQLSESYFWSASRGWLPLANPLVQSLKVDPGFRHSIVMTGTGHTLHFKQEEPTIKVTAAPVSFGKFSGWEDPQEMVEFASMVVNLSEEDLSLLQSKTWGLFPKFRGRRRPFCDVIQIMLAKSTTLGEAAEYLIAAQTTKEGKPEFPKSFYSSVAALSRMGMNGSGTHSVLIAELEKAVVFYFGCGRGWPVNEHSVDAIEASIARVVSDGFAAEIQEYLILLAARNFFEDKYAEKGYDRRDYLPQQLFQLMCSNPYASAHGLSYQNFAGASFQAMWKKYEGRMDAMPLFRPLLSHTGCPDQMREVARLHGKLREGMISVYVHDKRYDLNTFLSDLKTDRQLCTDFIQENGVVARAIAYELPSGETVLVHHAQQYIKSPAEMVDALNKTSTREMHLQTHLQIRIFHIFPLSRGSWPVVSWEGDVGTIIIDAENGW